MEDETVKKYKVKGDDLLKKIKGLLHESNVRRIIIKNEKGKTFMEIPLSVGVVGTIAAPLLVGIGAIAAMALSFTVEVVRATKKPAKKVKKVAKKPAKKSKKTTKK